MAYELYVLPVPSGGDVEESGEALLALLTDGLLAPDRSPAAEPRVAAVTDALLVSGAGLSPQDVPGARLLAADWGMEVAVTTRFVRFRVPFTRQGEAAVEAFEVLFDLLARVVHETGWAVYDPQDASQVPANALGRTATLDIYLSVMDQLDPGSQAI